MLDMLIFLYVMAGLYWSIRAVPTCAPPQFPLVPFIAYGAMALILGLFWPVLRLEDD